MDLRKFYQATDPYKTIKVLNPQEKPYYINFAALRGGPLIQQIYNKINKFSPDNPTCTLFTGNIGSGKSTELFCLQDQLQQAGFHVVYFTSDTELDMADVDVSDILLAIARNIAESIAKITIPLPQKLIAILKGAGKLLKTEIDITKVKVGVDKQALTVENTGQVTLALGLGEITTKIKDDSGLRHRLNEYLGNKKTQLIEAINEELLSPAIQQLKAQGKKA